MIALAVVLFTLTSRSETSKADAGISAGTRTAFGVYEEAADEGRAGPSRGGLRSPPAGRDRLGQRGRGTPRRARRRRARRRPRRALLAGRGAWPRPARPPASHRAARPSPPAARRSAPWWSRSPAPTRSRLGSSARRALTGQIGTFLDAARRLARGDFAHPVPVAGVREAVERLHVPSLDGRGSLRVTASFGVASVPESPADREDLVATADAALYRPSAVERTGWSARNRSLRPAEPRRGGPRTSGEPR